jgi:hypothetical protein
MTTDILQRALCETNSSCPLHSRASAWAGALPQPPLLAMAVLMATAVARLVEGVSSCLRRSSGLGAGGVGVLEITTGEGLAAGLGLATGLGLGLGLGVAGGLAGGLAGGVGDAGRHCAAALALASASAVLMAWPLPLALA